MWVNRTEFERLKHAVEILKRDVEILGNGHDRLTETISRETAPFLIGDLPLIWFLGCKDPRPTVTLRQAIEALRDHLKLRFIKTDAIPERIELEKIK